MHNQRDHKTQPIHRDVLSTWGIAALMFLALFGVSKYHAGTGNPAGGDIYMASEEGGVPRPTAPGVDPVTLTR